MDVVGAEGVKQVKHELVLLVENNGSLSFKHRIQIRLMMLSFFLMFLGGGIFGSLMLLDGDGIEWFQSFKKAHGIQVYQINYIKKHEIKALPFPKYYLISPKFMNDIFLSVATFSFCFWSTVLPFWGCNFIENFFFKSWLSEQSPTSALSRLTCKDSKISKVCLAILSKILLLCVVRKMLFSFYKVHWITKALVNTTQLMEPIPHEKALKTMVLALAKNINRLWYKCKLSFRKGNKRAQSV